MKKYTFGAYDRNGQLVELKVCAVSKEAAEKVASLIFQNSADTIDTDRGFSLIGEEEC